MEASTLQPTAALPRARIAATAPLLRFRSDEQLVALFRAGHEEAFRAIHDRYHKRLFAYTRQMLPGRQDAEDALQDVFVRAYSGLRASDRDLALRAWLFRVAHNRCIDELRKPLPPAAEVLEHVRSLAHDPAAEVDLRESLRRLVEDIRRLPGQQRSALLMRELAGMSYVELASSLGTSVGAVKSLLVRARLALAQAAEARDTACTVIREQLVEAHDRGVRPTANTRKHMRDCAGCKTFRRELRGVSRQLAATAPTAGPLGVVAKLLGFSGGGAGGGAAALSGGGTTASAGGLALGVNHVATLIAATVATAGGAVEIQRTILPAPARVHSHATAHLHRQATAQRSPASPVPLPAPGANAPAATAPASFSAALSTTAPSILPAAVPNQARIRRLRRRRAAAPTATGPGTTTVSHAGSSTSTAPSTLAGTPVLTGCPSAVGSTSPTTSNPPAAPAGAAAATGASTSATGSPTGTSCGDSGVSSPPTTPVVSSGPAASTGAGSSPDQPSSGTAAAPAAEGSSSGTSDPAAS